MNSVAVFWDMFTEPCNAPPKHLLWKARELADALHCETTAAVFTDRKHKIREKEIKRYGIDRAFVFLITEKQQYMDDIYIDAMSEFIRSEKPQIVLFPADVKGKSAAPRLAVRFHTGITADCLDLNIDGASKKMLQIRPACQGDLVARIVCPDSNPQIATYMGNTVKAGTAAGRCSIEYHKVTAGHSGFMEILKTAKRERDKTGTKIVIGIGKGVLNASNAALAFEAAELLHGSVAATREAVRAGWADRSFQVGQTGRKIRPDIYIAFGISGALQHLCGIMNPKCMVAVNSDPAAPIFQSAHIGMTADSGTILKIMTEKLKHN